MYSHLMNTTELTLGWDFYGPLIGMVVLILMGGKNLGGCRTRVADHVADHGGASSGTHWRGPV